MRLVEIIGTPVLLVILAVGVYQMIYWLITPRKDS